MASFDLSCYHSQMTPFIAKLIPLAILGFVVVLIIRRPRRVKYSKPKSSPRWKEFAEKLGLHFEPQGSGDSTTTGWRIQGKLDWAEVYLHQIYSQATGNQLGVTITVCFPSLLPFEIFVGAKNEEANTALDEPTDDELKKLECRSAELQALALLLGNPKKTAEEWLDSPGRADTLCRVLTEHPQASISEDGIDEFVSGDIDAEINEIEFERKLKSLAEILRGL